MPSAADRTPTPLEARAPNGSEREAWQRVLRLTAVHLVVWTVAAFGVAYFARSLDFVVLGWPFGFWVAAQGAPLVFLVLVVVYARQADRLDAEHATADHD